MKKPVASVSLLSGRHAVPARKDRGKVLPALRRGLRQLLRLLALGKETTGGKSRKKTAPGKSGRLGDRSCYAKPP